MGTVTMIVKTAPIRLMFDPSPEGIRIDHSVALKDEYRREAGDVAWIPAILCGIVLLRRGR